MTKYIALLRGINVGGHRKILMDDLRNAMQDLGLKNVKTYIQSGNLAFESDSKFMESIAVSIQGKIKTDFGFDVPAIVLTQERFQEYITLNDTNFGEEEPRTTMYIIFLSKIPELENNLKLSELPLTSAKLFLHEQVVYLNISVPYHKSKVNHALIEKHLGVKATARSLKSCRKFLEFILKP